MDIRRVDPDDAQAVETLTRINAASEEFENAYALPYAAPEHREQLRNLDSSMTVEGYLGFHDGTAVAAGIIELPQADNTEKSWVMANVAAGDRGRGHGSAMADFLITAARSLGRRTLMTDVRYPFDADESHPYRCFATKHGFSFSQADVHRVLHLPADGERLDLLLLESAPHHEEYTFIDFIGLPPAEIRTAYCVLLNQILTDAPSGEITYEEGRTTPETLAELVDSLSAQGRTLFTTVALDAAGAPVAHSQLVVPEHCPGKLIQWDTLVRRDHRGHRLGIATKVLNLQRVAPLYPDRTILHTWNAETNHHMIAVNQTMGFAPVGYVGEYYRKL